LLILTSRAGSFFVTAVLLAMTGFVFVAFASTANSTLQLTAGDDYRGRVMSVYALVFAGSSPLGNLFAGGVSDRFGARAGFLACGVAALLLMTTLLLFVRRKAAV
jgi:predicted MFS family arabinose efflux permease